MDNLDRTLIRRQIYLLVTNRYNLKLFFWYLKCSTSINLCDILLLWDLWDNQPKEIPPGGYTNNSEMVLIDYCKAFYIVDHELLLKKLEAYGIVNTELKWCRSYLNGRKQVVHLSGKESSGAPMENEIPQGSILGTLFFILFINDLPLHVSSQVDLCADDGTLAASAHLNNLLEL